MLRTLRRPTALLSLVLLPGLLLAGCGDDEDDTTEASASASASEAPAGESGDAPDTVSEGTLTVCSDTPYEPFEFEEDGEDVGYDIDLLRAIAEDAALELEVKDLPFDGILGSLAAGDCDVVASAVTITDERAEQVDFSEPYFDADQSLLVKSDQAGEIDGIDKLDGKSVGVQAGTTGETYAQENATGADVKAFEDSDGLFAAIEAGEIDAILQDLPVNAYRTTQDDSLEVVETYTTGEQYGFAVEKGNESILTFIDEGLAALREDGRFDEIYATYFGEAGE
jgi:polar amino acid transport system substrate-binding protein